MVNQINKYFFTKTKFILPTSTPKLEYSHASLTPLIFNPHYQWTLTLGSYSCYHLRILTWQGCCWGRREGTPGSWAEAHPASLTSAPECTSWQTESSPFGSCPRQEHTERLVNPRPGHKLDWENGLWNWQNQQIQEKGTVSHVIATCPRTHSLGGVQVLRHHLPLDNNVLLPQRLLFLLIQVHVQLAETEKKEKSKSPRIPYKFSGFHILYTWVTE